MGVCMYACMHVCKVLGPSVEYDQSLYQLFKIIPLAVFCNIGLRPNLAQATGPRSQRVHVCTGDLPGDSYVVVLVWVVFYSP